VADHSRDRVEAAQRAASDWETVIAEDGKKAIVWRGQRSTEQVVLDVLAALDDCDRVAGVVRVDTSDAAKIETAAKWLSSASRGWNWSHVTHESDREWWRQEALDFFAALGAAGVGEQQGGQT